MNGWVDTATGTQFRLVVLCLFNFLYNTILIEAFMFFFGFGGPL